MKRKKRLEKGIESLKRQLKIHEEKKKVAEKEGLLELTDYYEKEILSKERALKQKRNLLKKQ